MKHYLVTIFSLFIVFACIAQNQDSKEEVHPCNLIVTLFGKELKCGIITNGEYEHTGSCISDTTRYVSEWLNGKSRPRKGYPIRYSISKLDESNFNFSDSSYFLSQTDFSWEDSVGVVFFDTASFELIDSIAKLYEKDCYKDINNRIYIDRNIPIENNSKKFAIKTTHAAILITIYTPVGLAKTCIFDQNNESTFNYSLRLILEANFTDEENLVHYEITKN
ncbi:MAG: hypothetical protein E6Q37_05170 [Crocinitomicaceae bacterium]|nr:MAG: hypothetical protein E6Q37_05170 [Crocinitomicaceae bacterium]